MSRYATLFVILLLGGCQSTREQLLAQGYPPAFADGFQDGCSSGREAVGAGSVGFRKAVDRYLDDRLYASGWDDGFEQCKQQALSAERQRYENERYDDADDDWQRSKDRALGQALLGKP